MRVRTEFIELHSCILEIKTFSVSGPRGTPLTGTCQVHAWHEAFVSVGQQSFNSVNRVTKFYRKKSDIWEPDTNATEIRENSPVNSGLH